MKFTLAIPLLAVGALAATPVRRDPSLVQRDLATITSVVANIQSKISALDDAAKSFSGDGSGISSASDDVLSATKDGVSAISSSSEIPLTDALALQKIIGDLTTVTDTTVDDIIAQKEGLVAAGLGAGIEQSFVDQKAAAGTLAETITSKVPEAVQEIAAQLSQGIADSLQKGIDAFKGTGGASSTPAASTPAESTPAESTPAESTPASTPESYPTTVVSTTIIDTIIPTGTGYSSSPSGGLSTYASPTLTSSPPPFTGAAVPTAAAGYGVAAVAALVAAAAL